MSSKSNPPPAPLDSALRAYQAKVRRQIIEPNDEFGTSHPERGETLATCPLLIGKVHLEQEAARDRGVRQVRLVGRAGERMRVALDVERKTSSSGSDRWDKAFPPLERALMIANYELVKNRR